MASGNLEHECVNVKQVPNEIWYENWNFNDQGSAASTMSFVILLLRRVSSVHAFKFSNKIFYDLKKSSNMCDCKCKSCSCNNIKYYMENKNVVMRFELHGQARPRKYSQEQNFSCRGETMLGSLI